MASKKVLKDYIHKKDLRAINDPLELLADALLDNERLRRKITKCKCDWCLLLYRNIKFLIFWYVLLLEIESNLVIVIKILLSTKKWPLL